MSPSRIGDQPHGMRPGHRQLAQVHHGWLMLVLCGPLEDAGFDVGDAHSPYRGVPYLTSRRRTETA